MPKDLWDITDRKSTKTKLELIKSTFYVWLTIWQAQNWINNEWYVIDLFAGQGFYTDKGKKVPGSSVIFLKQIKNQIKKLKDKGIEIHLFSIEKNKRNFENLKNEINGYLEENACINDVVDCKILNGDCNEEIDYVLEEISNKKENPLFVLVDPTGLQIKRRTMDKIIDLKNTKDILFNYILEGVRRTSGIELKKIRGEKISRREIKAVDTLKSFLGNDIKIIERKKPEDLKVLKSYVNATYSEKNLYVVGYNVEYPDRKDDLYYLLFASKNKKIVQIVKDIYARQKEKIKGKTLFNSKEFYIKSILEITPVRNEKELNYYFIKRKHLLYKTKVEYGDWTINHIIGCSHGCRFPCYAMMMAKRFGWVKSYEDWRKPRIAENALDLLEKEIKKYKESIRFVHLSFMTDPFMYDFKKGELIPEVKNLSMQIIALLNKNGIRVTTLTKGFYPIEEIVKSDLLKSNEYGITLVSLNQEFKVRFEPYSAPYEKRIESLYGLHKAGLKTWVSIEPYPTPNLDYSAKNIEKLLEKIKFVDKLVFGKINYNTQSKHFEENEDFYKEISQKVINFCEKNGIKYHIKVGTPTSSNEINGKKDTKYIFSDSNE
ncbi:three-Cys-motif partner protein TcmP [Hippea alviniae]|uniref:three-Cys-motif partner protein TcmP n=1 Tax=Hippea alviniae TaxID=1279027 RepID=UPI0003B5A988|nr:three-Cys-motif partner protein TcmP [Hippea alviniae]